MTNSQIIAQNTRELCKKNNISISKLNEDCGFSKNFINEMEKKSASPSIDKVIIIADYFNVSLDSLVNRNNDTSNIQSNGLASYVLNYFNNLDEEEQVEMVLNLQEQEIDRYLKQEEQKKIMEIFIKKQNERLQELKNQGLLDKVDLPNNEVS